ncbi:aspartate kinase [Allofrancisella guangzhouensis]|uniref:Aspartokinase n=1 Tax=Allofrancisella guangzhouensis TaxID=594679 RepID=A0A0A8E2R7_9GAMM|nr:aspartate kinase [Allofrancisella guangzhouensis]AJC48490.1 aspartate kinase [Allofrancisella guangzhouensis]MBK2027605.1 aspartate kinase [Allofrancisella guangzhouensis]MBK2044082.1 aspartate kinase [Allofrancisella guangzhouensis]MBK2046530.1 aspartate kinase [Allofrancisella guangzhouensis]
MTKQFSVAKFGGTSVGSVLAIQKCIEIINNNKNIKIIVVSAQAGVTNLLEKLIISNVDSYKEFFIELHRIIDPIVEYVGNNEGLNIDVLFKELEVFCQRLYQQGCSLDLKLHAQILSFGERVSAALFNQALKKNGLRSSHIDARIIIKTDSNYIRAKPSLKDISDQINLCIPESEEVLVLEGFIGSNEMNETTVLGRGGSDYSAALIAEAVKADLLYIWTDVVGIHQVDPRLIPKSKVIRKINFDEAIELTNFGAKVLHPDTLWPVMRSSTKVFVGSTFFPERGGTYIENGPKDKKSIVRAITERKSQSLIKVKFSNNDVSSVVYRVFLVLKRYGVSPDIVNLTETSLSFVIPQIGESIEQLIIKDLNLLDGVIIDIERNLSLTAIVGNNLDKLPKLLNKVIKASNVSNIKLSGYGANGSSLYLLTDSRRVLERVYKALF